MKKSFLLLVLALLVSNSAMSTLIDSINYYLSADNTAVVIAKSGTGYSGTIVIPSYVIYNEKQFSVTSIGYRAFDSCTGLTSVTIPNSVIDIEKWAFFSCSGLTSVSFGNNVTDIGEEAFCACTGLTSVTIPNSVVNIGERAFEKCRGLTSIEIPNSVTSIGYSAFYDCTGLTSVTILSNAIVSKNYTSTLNFWHIFGAQVQEYIIGESVTSIGEYAFFQCNSLTSFMIPNSVTNIGCRAFDRCTGLSSVIIPNSVTSIGAGAFQYCTGLTSITIPNSVTSIGEGTFSSCRSLTTITIPNSVTNIGDYAFMNCTGLTTITIPNSVTSIGDYAFMNCTGLTTITIPNSVTSIGTSAFSDCTGLTSVTCEAITPPASDNDVFLRIFCSNIPLYVPAESVNAYKYAPSWRNFNPILPIGFIGYTITFNNWDGTELLKLTYIEHGTMPVYTGNTPTRPDDAFYTYTFKGWSPNIVEATQDATYVAVYDEHPRTTDIKEVSAKTDVTKSLRDGKLVIQRDGKTYSVTGHEVK